MKTNSASVLRISIFIGLLTLLFTPFIMHSGLFFPYITGKAYFFRIVVEIIFFLWLILAVFEPKYRPQKNILLYSATLFVISIFVSDYFGVNKDASFWSTFERMEGFVAIIHFYALFLVAGSVLKTRTDWRILFDTSIVFALVAGLASLPDFYKASLATPGFRNEGGMGNSIYFAVYIMFNFFFAIFNLNISKNSATKIYYIISTLFLTYFLTTTITRGTVLALIGGLTIMLVGTFIIRFKKRDIYWKVSTAILAGMIVLVLAFWTNRNSNFVKQNALLNRFSEISLTGGTSQARVLNWKIATEGIKQRPILGWGQSNYNYVFDKNYLPSMHGNEYMFDRVHNIFFDWAIAGGLLGLILFLSMFVSAIYLVIKSPKFDLNSKLILIGIIGAYFINNFFVFDQIISYMYIFMILALVYSETSEKPICEHEMSDYFKWTVAALSIIFIPFVIYNVNAESIKGNKMLISANQLVLKSGEGYIFAHPQGIRDNINYFKDALKYTPEYKLEITQRMFEVMLSSLNIQGGIPELDRREFVEMTLKNVNEVIDSGNVDSRAPYLLVQYYLKTGDTNKAIEAVDRAINMSPNRQSLKVLKSQILMSQKKTKEAYELIKATYESEKTKDDVWKSYASILSTYDKKLFEVVIDEETKNNPNRVEDLLLTGIKNKPDVLQARISLAAFYFKQDRKDESIKVLEQAIKDMPKSKYAVERVINIIKTGGDPTLAQ